MPVDAGCLASGSSDLAKVRSYGSRAALVRKAVVYSSTDAVVRPAVPPVGLAAFEARA